LTTLTAEGAAKPATVRTRARHRRWHEARILLVLIAIALVFEVIGWSVRGDSFLFNSQRLLVMVLQVSIVGLLAIGVTQVIITGGIDLSSGSIVALSAMIAASLAQTSGNARAVFPSLTDLPFVVPVLAGIATGALAGAINGSLIAFTAIPPFIATLGMMVTARGLARYYTRGQPIGLLSDSYTRIGEGAVPVLIFVVAAIIFYVALRYTRYGKFTYAIGANPQAARVSGINVGRHLVLVYIIAGCLSGLGGVVTSARAASGQAGMGISYELDAIAAAVIGGTSLSGGFGRFSGSVIGSIILGVMSSGFTFIGFVEYFQDIVKGVVIVLAVVADQYRQRKRRSA
jgi:inositol transport system permease protein